VISFKLLCFSSFLPGGVCIQPGRAYTVLHPGCGSAIQGIAHTNETISAIAGAIAAAVEQQGAATGEIARNIQQTAQATSDGTDIIDGVRDTADETGKYSGRVLERASGLSTQAGALSREVSRFVQTVRAA